MLTLIYSRLVAGIPATSFVNRFRWKVLRHSRVVLLHSDLELPLVAGNVTHAALRFQALDLAPLKNAIKDMRDRDASEEWLGFFLSLYVGTTAY